MRPGLLCLLLLWLVGCGPEATRRGATVLFASGADLQSINPLFTVHPLARQVQRYVLLTTLVRYDSLMRVQPYLARSWRWSRDRRTLTFRLTARLRWHDGVPTTASDAAWTLDQARALATGYPRQSDLAELSLVRAPDDTTLVLDWSRAPPRMPDVLTDLAILPRHLLDTVPPGRLREAAWNQHPVGNGPFRFVLHEANRRWVFARDPSFPALLGGPPHLERLVVAVVDEPMTKLAALTAGEIDFAGIQPAHAAFVRRDPTLVVRDYPLLFTQGIVFNARRPPFDSPAARRRVSAGLDRQALVDGVVWGFGTPATGPIPPELGNRVPGPPPGHPPPAPRDGGPLEFELLTVGSGEAALEQMIQAQLARHGIHAVIRQLELSAFLERVYGPGHDFQAAVLGTPGDLGLGYLTHLADLSGIRRPSDDEPSTPEHLVRLLGFFRDSMPVAFLYHSRGLQGANRRVRGVQLGLRGELASVARWSVAQ